MFVDLGVGDGERGEWLLDNILVGLHDRYVGLDSWKSHPEQEDQARRRLGRFGENAVLLRNLEIMEILCVDSPRHYLVKPGIDMLHCADIGNTWVCYGLDMMAAFLMMTVGGLLIVSDYRQKGRRKNPALQQAADGFARSASDKIEIVVRNSQAIYRKIQSAE